eukprot:4936803-Alexandrium_andersonii.AAC.1
MPNPPDGTSSGGILGRFRDRAVQVPNARGDAALSGLSRANSQGLRGLQAGGSRGSSLRLRAFVITAPIDTR